MCIFFFYSILTYNIFSFFLLIVAQMSTEELQVCLLVPVSLVSLFLGFKSFKPFTTVKQMFDPEKMHHSYTNNARASYYLLHRKPSSSHWRVFLYLRLSWPRRRLCWARLGWRSRGSLREWVSGPRVCVSVCALLAGDKRTANPMQRIPRIQQPPAREATALPLHQLNYTAHLFTFGLTL